MTNLTFQIQNFEYIELNKLLKIMNLVESGGEANTIIENGEVKVNDVLETQKRKKLRPGDKVEFQDVRIELS